MIIDVHAHCYPKAYMEELKKIGVGEDGGVGIPIPEWSSTEERLEKMDAIGIDVQLLSLSAPNVYFADGGLSVDLARMTNDFIADVCRKHPDRFLSLASLPLNSPDQAFEELERAIGKLGMDGVVLGTNVNQRSLAADEFLPVLEELDRRQTLVALHPMKAVGEDLMPAEDKKLAIPTMVGFIFETTRTVVQMVLKGTFEKCRNLTFILPHAGGAIPFVYPRWDMTYLSRAGSSHAIRKLPNPPSHYLKRHYYDTTHSFFPSPLRCTIDLAGIDHVLFGTDVPYSSRDFRAREMVEKVSAYGSREESEKILFRNALGLFPRVKERTGVRGEEGERGSRNAERGT